MNKVILLSAILFTGTASATLITHGSSGGVFTSNNGTSSAPVGGFDRAEFSFSSVFADTIDISNFGSGFAHSHSAPAFAEVDVFDGSSWINVFTSSVALPTGSGIALSSLFSTPIVFSGMNISGLRLDSSIPVSYAYHSVNSNMQYKVTSVSEPSSLVLLGMGLLSFVAWRRRQH